MRRIFAVITLVSLLAGWTGRCEEQTPAASEALVNAPFGGEDGPLVTPAFTGEGSAVVVTPAFGGASIQPGGPGRARATAPGRGGPAAARNPLFMAQAVATPPPVPAPPPSALGRQKSVTALGTQSNQPALGQQGSGTAIGPPQSNQPAIGQQGFGTALPQTNQPAIGQQGSGTAIVPQGSATAIVPQGTTNFLVPEGTAPAIAPPPPNGMLPFGLPRTNSVLGRPGPWPR